MNLKPAYTISEFATMLGEPLATIRRRVGRKTYPTEMVGGKRYICMASLQEVFPQLWESIVRVEALRQAASSCDRRGQTGTVKRQSV